MESTFGDNFVEIFLILDNKCKTKLIMMREDLSFIERKYLIQKHKLSCKTQRITKM